MKDTTVSSNPSDNASLLHYIKVQRAFFRKITTEIAAKWATRIAPQRLFELGETGAEAYLSIYGRNIGERKLIGFAMKAEAEGYKEMALGFWKKAFEVSSGGESNEDQAVSKKAKMPKKVSNSSKTTGNQPVRILFLAANPEDTDQLRLDWEARAIDTSLRGAEYRDKFDIRSHWAVRVTDLQGLLLRYNPNIVHFSGHGSNYSEIILENNSGVSHSVPADALGLLFGLFKDSVKCVVLNACYSEKQAQAISQNIDCVIGMSRSIRDDSAIAFAGSFYQGLGYGRDVKSAFELGCLQIHMENLQEQDKPKLIDPRSVAHTTRFV
jgi:hypothetical protein